MLVLVILLSLASMGAEMLFSVTIPNHIKATELVMVISTPAFVFTITLAMVDFPISMDFLTGALCMVLTRILKIGEACEAIEWK